MCSSVADILFSELRERNQGSAQINPKTSRILGDGISTRMGDGVPPRPPMGDEIRASLNRNAGRRK